MKYVIEFKEEPIEINFPNGMSEYYPCINLPGLSLPKEDLDELTPYNREAIENEVWGLVGVIANMDNNDYGRVFGCIGRWTLLSKKTYQEVKAKYEAWKKSKEEIHVGDEVKITENGSRCIVWGIASGVASLIFEDCGTTRYSIDKLIKTGRHFDEVEKLLERMREE